jgi:hypothetical protein
VAFPEIEAHRGQGALEYPDIEFIPTYDLIFRIDDGEFDGQRFEDSLDYFLVHLVDHGGSCQGMMLSRLLKDRRKARNRKANSNNDRVLKVESTLQS